MPPNLRQCDIFHSPDGDTSNQIITANSLTNQTRLTLTVTLTLTDTVTVIFLRAFR